MARIKENEIKRDAKKFIKGVTKQPVASKSRTGKKTSNK
jgi:hypothetical protein